MPVTLFAMYHKILNQCIQIFHDNWMSKLMCTSDKLWEWGWRATARLQGWREREWEWRLFKLNALIGSTHGNLLSEPWHESDDRVTVGQQGVRWLQVTPGMTAHTYIAWIPLLAYGLTLKLSPCPCSHSCLAGWIAACLCGHSKWDLLLAQARPRMILHLTSYALVPYFTVEAPMSNKRPPPIFAKKSCVGLIALELAPTVNYWFKG